MFLKFRNYEIKLIPFLNYSVKDFPIKLNKLASEGLYHPKLYQITHYLRKLHGSHLSLYKYCLKNSLDTLAIILSENIEEENKSTYCKEAVIHGREKVAQEIFDVRLDFEDYDSYFEYEEHDYEFGAEMLAVTCMPEFIDMFREYIQEDTCEELKKALKNYKKYPLPMIRFFIVYCCKDTIQKLKNRFILKERSKLNPVQRYISRLEIAIS